MTRSWRVCVRACALLSSLLMLAALMAPTADAAEPPPLPAETFFRHPSLLDVRLSPSGRYVALTSVHDDKRVALLVVDLQNNTPARVLAFYDKQDVVWFRWLNDERLLYRLGRIEPARSFTHLAGLFAVDVEGKRQVELICSEIKSCHFQNGLLSWGYELIHIPTPQAGVKPDEAIVSRYENVPNGWVPYWLDTTVGTVRRITVPKVPEPVQNWWFNSRGEPRLILSVDTDAFRGTYYWLAPGADKWRELARFHLLRQPFTVVGVSDDDQLYVTEERGAARESVLTTFDFTSGKPAVKPVVEVPGFDFKGSLLDGKPGEGIVGVRVEADSEVTVWLDPAMKRFQAEVDQRYPGQVNTITCSHCGGPDMVALVHSFSDKDPGRYFLYRAQSRHWESVAIAMPGVDPQRMASVDFQRIKARDGREIPVWLTLPTGAAAGKPAPAVVMPHGGPWVRGSYWRWEPMAQFLASRGYLVIEPEFRGSEGYGGAHFEAGFKQWGRAMQDDLADALLWARKQGLANDKACIAGASYGGYATLMGLVRNPELYRCGVAWVAVSDLFLYLDGGFFVWDDIGTASRRHALPEVVGDTSKDAAALTAVSPVAQAALIRAPLLLAYGEDDVRVPLAHGKRLREAMIKAGNPPDWIVYPNEGHGWAHTATRVDFAQRMEAFLAKHLNEP